MNSLTLLIVLALLGIYGIELLAKILNLRTLSPEVPEKFRDVYEGERYRQAQHYTRARSYFDAVTSTTDLLVLFVFWGAGGFESLDRWVHGRAASPLAQGLIYVGVLLAAKTLLFLPFEIYSTFILEEKFGFNKTTWRTFITDRLKGYVLTLLLGGVVLTGLLAFFLWAGPWAWVYGWLSLALFQLFLQWVAPTWIMPLFNKFVPLEEGVLKSSIMDYARSVKFSLQNIFVMDGSKRSSKSNAFFTGFGKNKRIALFDTLIEKHSVEELTAVLAHEIGHYKKKHVLNGFFLSVLHHGVLFYLLSLFLTQPALFEAFGVGRVSVHGGLVLFGIVYSPLSFLLSVVLQAYSRRNEFEADRYAVETYRRPQALVTALKTLSVTNLANLTPHPFYVFLHYSHPPLLKRLAAIEKRGKALA